MDRLEQLAELQFVNLVERLITGSDPLDKEFFEFGLIPCSLRNKSEKGQKKLIRIVDYLGLLLEGSGDGLASVLELAENVLNCRIIAIFAC